MKMEAQKFKANRHKFYVDLARALDDKEVLTTYFEVASKRARERKKPKTAQFYRMILARLDSGSLAHALRPFLPPFDIMLLTAYESGEKLTDGLRMMAKAVLVLRRMKMSIAGAVIFPTFMLVFLGLMQTFMAIEAIPALESVSPSKNWPAAGQALAWMAKGIRSNGLYIVALSAAFGYLIGWLLPTWTGPYRRKLEDIPFSPFQIYRDYQGALFLLAVGAMLSAKVSLVDALQRLRANNSSKWFNWHINMIMKNLNRDSDNPGRAMATGIFNREVSDRIEDYSRRSSFISAMEKLGVEMMDDTADQLANMAKKLNIVLMLVVGALFIFTVIGFLTTSYDLDRQVRRQMRADNGQIVVAAHHAAFSPTKQGESA